MARKGLRATVVGEYVDQCFAFNLFGLYRGDDWKWRSLWQSWKSSLQSTALLSFQFSIKHFEYFKNFANNLERATNFEKSDSASINFSSMSGFRFDWTFAFLWTLLWRNTLNKRFSRYFHSNYVESFSEAQSFPIYKGFQFQSFYSLKLSRFKAIHICSKTLSRIETSNDFKIQSYQMLRLINSKLFRQSVPSFNVTSTMTFQNLVSIQRKSLSGIREADDWTKVERDLRAISLNTFRTRQWIDWS